MMANIQIDISQNGTTTLATGGKYCDRNIDVNVEVPASDITPSGTKEITENGTFDVTNFASALVNVSGLNARVYTATLSADKTGEAAFLTNDWLKTIRSDANAFVFVRFLGMAASTAQVQSVLSANFPLYYNGATMYNSIVMRATASSGGTNPNNRGLNQNGGDQYNGHLNISSSGKLYAYGNASYPFKAGTYQIIAGTVEML